MSVGETASARYPPRVSRTPEYAAALRSALARAVSGADAAELARATEALVARYRSVAPASAPILASAGARRGVCLLPDAGHARRLWRACSTPSRTVAWRPARCSTSVAARVRRRGRRPVSSTSLESITVLDQVEDALALGRDLVADAPSPALAGATFRRAVAGAWPDLEADLVTVSYVLSELDERQQDALVADAMRRGRAVVVAEPGTPDGYARVLRVRSALLGGRLDPARPVPACGGLSSRRQGDWCHFAARVNRSAEHRRLKGAELSYEDEKFSWVAAACPGVVNRSKQRRCRAASSDIP